MLSTKKDFKQGFVSLKVTLSDDLWYLSMIIAPHDEITSKTERKIKIGDGPDSNQKVIRKTIILTIAVESVTLSDDMSQLRVKGIVIRGPDDVPHGSYHTFGLSIDDSFTLKKSSWPRYAKERLEESLKNNASSILFVLFDREQAHFAKVSQSGIDFLADIKADAQKKQYVQSGGESIYFLIVKQLEQYEKSYSPSYIVGVSPAFWKENLSSILPASIMKKMVFITSTTINHSIIQSLLSRPELHHILADQRLQKEEYFMADLLKYLSDDQVAYGFVDVKSAASMGALKNIGVSQSFLQKSREEGFFDDLDKLLKIVDAAQGEVQFIQAPDAQKKLNGLGGIAGVLRWKQQ